MTGPLTLVSGIANNPQTNLLQTLPSDVTLIMLSSLSPVNVAAFCCLSKYSNAVASNPMLWKGLVSHYCGSSAFDLFSPLVDKGLITWKEAWCYRSLPTFLSRVSERRYQCPGMGIEKNNTPSNTLIQPIVMHQDVPFVIMNSSDIEMQSQKEIAYRGESGTLLTHLAHDGTCVYAYRQDGILIQWDPMTGKSRNIKTRYFRNARSKEKTRIRSCDRLLAQDGYVILLYTLFNHAPLFEIIDLEKNKSSIIQDEMDRNCSIYRMQVHNKKLYRIRSNCCYVRNLETNSEESSFSVATSDRDDRILGLNFYKNQIYIITLKSRLAIITPGAIFSYQQRLDIPEDTMNGSTLGHLFLKCDHVSRSSVTMMIMNSKTGEMEKVSLFESGQFRPDSFEEIVTICKANDPFETNESSFWIQAHKAAGSAYAWFSELMW